jgi:hypothetical protein
VNRVVKTIFGSTGDEVTEGCRKLYKEGFHNFFSSPNIIRVITSGTMIWVGNAERMEVRNVYNILI